MIIVGKTNPKILNPKQIIHISLTKNRPTIYVNGEIVEGTPIVEDFNVKEPWAVCLTTAVDKHYINCSDIEEAIEVASFIGIEIDKQADRQVLEDQIRRAYGQEKESNE